MCRWFVFLCAVLLMLLDRGVFFFRLKGDFIFLAFFSSREEGLRKEREGGLLSEPAGFVSSRPTRVFFSLF